MASRLNLFIFIGVLIELILFVYFFYFNDAIEDVFRLSARYTGRISFGLYLLMFYHFINERSKGKVLQNTYLWGMVFCVLHIVHFAYLSAAVYFNDLPIVPHKIAGGFLAYLAIVIYPFYMMKIKRLAFIWFIFITLALWWRWLFLLGFVGSLKEPLNPLFTILGLYSLFLFLCIALTRFLKPKRLEHVYFK